MRRVVYVLLGVLCIVGTSVSGQEVLPGLSADDAALLAAANAAFPASFGFDYSAHLSVSGLDSFAINVALEGAGAVDRNAPAFDTILRGTAQLGSTQSIPVDVAARWVDDTLYLNPGTGWQARAGGAALLGEWIGQYAALGADPAALGRWDVFGIGGLSDLLVALASADPASFLSAQRLGDEAVGEAQSAHFQFSADLHALMQTEAFTDAVGVFAATQGNNLVVYSGDELANFVRGNSAAFANAIVTIDEFVGLDDGTIQRLVLDLDMPLDPTQIGYTEAPFSVTASLDVTLRDANVPQSISVPDGAEAVADFMFPAPPAPEVPGVGSAQYVYFAVIGENETYSQTFDGTAGSTVTITARGLGLDFDGMLMLLAPGGATLAEDDDHANPAFGVGDLDPQIAGFALPEDGAYTVEVSEINGAAGSFVLSITLQP